VETTQSRRRPDGDDDSWDVALDAMRARSTLAVLSPLHRAVLTLRYLDDLSVPDVAGLVDRSVHATEGLLVRARAAFRRAYGEEEVDDG
jgi:RNA polymerase sigma-70 factor (ECF subfamily)